MLLKWIGQEIRLDKMKFFIFIFVFLIIGALLIISNNNLVLIEDRNLEKFFEIYVSWLDGIYSNVQVLTGNVVEMGWLPE